MKNIICIIMLLAYGMSYGQTGALTVVNSTGCDYRVVLHAQSFTISGSTGCNDIITAAFVVPASTTFSWTDPYDVETGGCYDPTCSCSCGPLGWTTITGGTVSGLWGSYPSDWVWTYATVDYWSCGCGVAGDVGLPSCTGGAGYSINDVCGLVTYTADFTLGSCFGGPCDVTVSIY